MALRDAVELLRGRYREALTSAGSVVALVLGLQLSQATGRTVCLGLAVAVGSLAGASTYRRARAIGDIATSRIGSAAQGYVEVMGRASVAPGELIASPVSGMACIWYRFRVYSKDDGRNEWRQIDSGVSSSTFEISDPSGNCRVDPDHAEVVSAERRVSYRNGDKVVEELLFGGCQIYVLGELTTVGGATAALSVSEDVGELLATWKKDPVDLRRRFDLDGNGTIDLQEWALARRLAVRTVEQQHRDIRQQGELHLLRAPRDGRMFLISPLAPRTLRQRFLGWTAFHLAVAMVGLALLLWWGW